MGAPDSKMDNAPSPLPVPLERLPASIQRFCNPSGPAPARLMAARGLVPVKGNDQVMLLAQLACDNDEPVRTAALESLTKLP
ncbi:MAG TPA: hypothetical protein VFG30_26675, partial [Polyangiales bacterium]|nr:hypothetical protein [Polyangiales bacterium]